MQAWQMREQLEVLQSKVLVIAGESMLEHKEEIVGLIIHQQNEEGIDSEGNALREYSPQYKREKEFLGLYTGKTDFNLTGEYLGEMNLTISGDGETYSFNSPSQTPDGVLKSEWLEKWNGTPIMLLTPENESLIYPIIKETFDERINEELALD